MNLIELLQGSTALVLQGTGMAAPYKGAVLGPATGEGDSIEEPVTLSLEGTAAQIESAIGDLQDWLSEAERVSNLAGADYVFLVARVQSSGSYWRSKVLHGWIELLGAGASQRLTGSQGLTLHLTRANYWEDTTESSLSLTSVTNTSGTTGGATVQNVWDSANGNWVHLASTVLSGDLPTPTRLYYNSSYAGNGTLYAGQNLSSTPASAALTLQGEDGTAVSGGATVTDTSSSSSSGGYFARVTWSGATDTGLLDLALSSTLMTQLAGWPFLPIMRLGTAAGTGAGLWAYWRVIARHASGDNILAESRPAYLSETAILNAGTPLHLPPWQVVTGETQQGLYLQLRCQGDGTGAHQLDVDHVFLMPLEYWRFYRPTMSYVSGLRVEDDGYRGVVKSYGVVQGHTADGPGFWLWPGRAQRFYFLAEGMTAGVPIDQSATVYLYARPRKRIL